MTERELVSLLTKEFTPLLRQSEALPVEFSLTNVNFVLDQSKKIIAQNSTIN